jgi:hypothetical protein
VECKRVAYCSHAGDGSSKYIARSATHALRAPQILAALSRKVTNTTTARKHATLCADCIVRVSTGAPIFACSLIHILDAAPDIDMCASRGGTSVAIGVSAGHA